MKPVAQLPESRPIMMAQAENKGIMPGYFAHLQRGHEAGGAIEHADEQAQRFLQQRVALWVAQIQRVPQQPPQHALELCAHANSCLFMHGWTLHLCFDGCLRCRSGEEGSKP